jgi:D-aminopeptidase
MSELSDRLQATEPRPRARDLGIEIGSMLPGAYNAITDVPGVRVGHVTIVEGAGALRPEGGPFRTGATAVLPHEGDLFHNKVHGVIHSINGFGEVTNQQQVDELGVIEGPIVLTNTTNVPRVQDAVIQWMLERHPEMGTTTWTVSPVVAECSDFYLNDIRGRRVGYPEVRQAIESAQGGEVAEGSVGAGTGMTCFGFKGGVGTASRVLPAEFGRFAVGVLVVSNFGYREMLRVDGVPVGRELRNWQGPQPDGPRNPADAQLRVGERPAGGAAAKDEGGATSGATSGAKSGAKSGADDGAGGDGGSIVMVLATDAPVTARQLRRLAVRCGAGLAHIGSFYGNNSGDFVIAFSTANKVLHVPPLMVVQAEQVAEDGPAISALFRACFEATEEAILNSLLRATTVVGRDDHVRHALPIDRLVELMHQYGHPEVHLPNA